MDDVCGGVERVQEDVGVEDESLVQIGLGEAGGRLPLELGLVPALLDHRPPSQRVQGGGDVLEDGVTLSFDGLCKLKKKLIRFNCKF
jgi:hypothetical protein